MWIIDEYRSELHKEQCEEWRYTVSVNHILIRVKIYCKSELYIHERVETYDTLFIIVVFQVFNNVYFA